MISEINKVIPDIHDFKLKSRYIIDEFGIIMDTKKDRKFELNKGYAVLRNSDGKRKTFTVNRLLYYAFYGVCDNNTFISLEEGKPVHYKNLIVTKRNNRLMKTSPLVLNYIKMNINKCSVPELVEKIHKVFKVSMSPATLYALRYRRVYREYFKDFEFIKQKKDPRHPRGSLRSKMIDFINGYDDIISFETISDAFLELPIIKLRRGFNSIPVRELTRLHNNRIFKSMMDKGDLIPLFIIDNFELKPDRYYIVRNHVDGRYIILHRRVDGSFSGYINLDWMEKQKMKLYTTYKGSTVTLTKSRFDKVLAELTNKGG